MKVKPFEIERYFAKYEFSARYLLSNSECSGLSQSEVLSWADPETKQLWDNLKLGYTESLGLPLLRKEIATLYNGISADEVMLVVPEEGIFIALNSLLDKGDHVICTWPGYQSLYEIVESLGCDLTKWQPNEEAGWKFNVDFLEQQIKPTTKLIIVNFPHNPTGYLPSREDFQRIIEIARKHNIYIFSDEMYRLLELDPEDRLPSASEAYEKAVSLFGMSKTFGMAGVRIGWLTTKDYDLYQKMATFKDYTTICASAPSELLALSALRSKEKILQRHLGIITKNLSLLDDFFQKHSHLFSWVRPKAGSIGFPRMLFDENSLEFSERVVNDAGIMILPSTVYAYDDIHFRLGFGHEDMPQVLAEFEKYLRAKPPK
jgi:aspartate/methionine/tyrosine aminotransferase